MSDWDRVERLIGAGNLARLAQCRVAVIGLGSGGGFVALALAMSGVGHFVLIDDDTLEAPNIVRHVADRRYLGQPKAEAVADLIRQRNPQAQVEARVGRIEAHMDALVGVDLVVVGVDGEQTKYRINEVCLERELTAVYAGVYERGEGGDVVLIRPDDLTAPCYSCWSAVTREDVASALSGSDEPAELDYGMIGADGTLEAEPGLWLHVVRVASAQADMALNDLLRGTDAHRPMPGNTVILANVALEILTGQVTPPYGALWLNVERDPACLVCGGRPHADGSHTEQTHMSLDDLIASGVAIQDDAAKADEEGT
jgi:molybdopterin/thiamine biosynthesis adenylyltransferase